MAEPNWKLFFEIDQPANNLFIVVSAWRKVKNYSQELNSNRNLLAPWFLKLHEFWHLRFIWFSEDSRARWHAIYCISNMFKLFVHYESRLVVFNYILWSQVLWNQCQQICASVWCWDSTHLASCFPALPKYSTHYFLSPQQTRGIHE